MLISLSKKFIFVANTKTASTTIEKILLPFAEINTIGAAPEIKHMSIVDIMYRFNNILNFDKFFKFGVIRHPVDWFLSWFNYRSGNPHILSPLPDNLSIEEFFESGDWVLKLSQKSMFCDSNGNVLVDLVIPYDELDHYLYNILAFLKIPLNEIPKENVSHKKVTIADLSQEFKNKLIEHYREDLEFYLFWKSEAPRILNKIMKGIVVDFSYLKQEGELPFPEGEIQRLNYRKWILNYAKKEGIGAEVGVFRGHFAEILLKELKPKKLYLIDPWTKIGEKWGWGENSPYTAYGKVTTKYAREDTKRRILPYIDECEIIIVEDFVENFIFPEKLDWIYLDTSHTYEDTLRQINYLIQFLKPEGVLMGDNWNPDPFHQHHGVFKAVNEFIKNNPGWEIVACGYAAQWCIRRKTNVVIQYQLNKISEVEFGKFIDDWHIDYIPRVVNDDTSISLNGVIVINEKYNQNDFELILVKNNEEIISIAWFINSPWYAQKHPQNSNAKKARFSSSNFNLKNGDVLTFLISNKVLQEKIEILRITRKD
ncbi:MAG: class I SAM-dependent methyltransferase [Candidatus Aenigmatarchaeota archaeon]